MASLLSNRIGYRGREFDGSPDILGMLSQFSTNMGDKALILMTDKTKGSVHLGTAIRSVATGDTIVLLEGADWPVVLRQTGENWIFIGPAFLSGIMDGEAWSNGSETAHDLRKFILV